MGMYDCLPKGSQVKLWNCILATKEVGDTVLDFGLPEYIVLLREGGFIKVENGIITVIVENLGKPYFYPEHFPDIPCFDKYGNQVTTRNDLVGELQEIMEDSYYPKEKENPNAH